MWKSGRSREDGLAGSRAGRGHNFPAKFGRSAACHFPGQIRLFLTEFQYCKCCWVNCQLNWNSIKLKIHVHFSPIFFKFENIFFENFLVSGSRLQAQHHINSNITSQIISIQSDNSIIVIMPPTIAWSQMEIQDWRHVRPHLGTTSV